ncbi:MAG: hypothetical protein CME57_02180 [Halieaceae bacterium]|nr:hypothetical protein [Halieaceae bacterium]
MSSVSLIPDRQLTFSPELAETIGLEEAVLLQALGTLFENNQSWTTVRISRLQHTLSFWSVDHITSLIDKLVSLGILRQQPGDTADSVLLTALTDEPHTPSGAATPSAIQQQNVAWQPSAAIEELLSLNHGIPPQFIEQTAAQFVPTEGREVDTQFRQFVLGRWREKQQSQTPQPSAFEISTPLPFGRNWLPSQDALDILSQAGIDIVFAESVRAEFILYWSERGGPPKEVNSRFVEHVRRRWLKHTSQMRHSTELTRIARNWRPDPSVYETLELAGIEENHARALLPEFVMYWLDSNEVHTSWNSKFLQHVKRQCRGAGHGDQDGRQTGRGNTGTGHRSKDRSLNDDLSDTSWAK